MAECVPPLTDAFKQHQTEVREIDEKAKTEMMRRVAEVFEQADVTLHSREERAEFLLEVGICLGVFLRNNFLEEGYETLLEIVRRLALSTAKDLGTMPELHLHLTVIEGNKK